MLAGNISSIARACVELTGPDKFLFTYARAATPDLCRVSRYAWMRSKVAWASCACSALTFSWLRVAKTFPYNLRSALRVRFVRSSLGLAHTGTKEPEAFNLSSSVSSAGDNAALTTCRQR